MKLCIVMKEMAAPVTVCALVQIIATAQLVSLLPIVICPFVMANLLQILLVALIVVSVQVPILAIAHWDMLAPFASKLFASACPITTLQSAPTTACALRQTLAIVL